jgi:hypothetical protein
VHRSGQRGEVGAPAAARTGQSARLDGEPRIRGGDPRDRIRQRTDGSTRDPGPHAPTAAHVDERVADRSEHRRAREVTAHLDDLEPCTATRGLAGRSDGEAARERGCEAERIAARAHDCREAGMAVGALADRRVGPRLYARDLGLAPGGIGRSAGEDGERRGDEKAMRGHLATLRRVPTRPQRPLHGSAVSEPPANALQPARFRASCRRPRTRRASARS